jgi:hypothetical protein
MPVIAIAIVLSLETIIAARAGIAHQRIITEMLPMVRHCVERHECVSHGVTSELEPLYHGAVWLRLLTAVEREWHDQSRAQTVVVALSLLSIALTFVFMTHYLGLLAATATLGLSLPVVFTISQIAEFTYSNILPLPFALYCISLALYAERELEAFTIIGAAALGLAVSIQLGCMLMVPFHGLLVALTARRPLVTLIFGAIAFTTVFAGSSWDAATEVIRFVATTPAGVVALFALAGLLLVLRIRPNPVLWSMPVRQRVHGMMIATLLWGTFVPMLAGPLGGGVPPGPKFLIFSGFAFLYLVGERLVWLTRGGLVAIVALEMTSLALVPFATNIFLRIEWIFWAIMVAFGVETAVRLVRGGVSSVPIARSAWPAAALCVGLMMLEGLEIATARARGPEQAFTLAEAEEVVRLLYGAGYTYSELLGSLQGPAADDLLPLLTDRDPALFEGATATLTRAPFTLLVLKPPSAPRPIVVRGEPTFLDWTHVRRCSRTRDPQYPAGYHCEHPATLRPLIHKWPFVEFEEVKPMGGANERPAGVRFEVPVDTPGRGIAHVIRVTSEWPSTWRISKVDGVQFEGTVPGVELKILDEQPSVGSVVLNFVPPVAREMPWRPWLWIPHLLEVNAENEYLLEPFRGR